MARFDLYANPSGSGILLDVQSNLFEMMQTRVVIPLVRPADAPPTFRHLNPEFVIDGSPFFLITQLIATVPTAVLSQKIGSLSAEADKITRATDMLFQGF